MMCTSGVEKGFRTSTPIIGPPIVEMRFFASLQECVGIGRVRVGVVSIINITLRRILFSVRRIIVVSADVKAKVVIDSGRR